MLILQKMNSDEEDDVYINQSDDYFEIDSKA